MKLTEELKQKIDNFFASKTPEETYDLLVKYGIISFNDKYDYIIGLKSMRKKYKYLKKEVNSVLDNIYVIKQKLTDNIRECIPFGTFYLVEELHKNRNKLKMLEKDIREVKQKIKQFSRETNY